MVGKVPESPPEVGALPYRKTWGVERAEGQKARPEGIFSSLKGYRKTWGVCPLPYRKTWGVGIGRLGELGAKTSEDLGSLREERPWHTQTGHHLMLIKIF